MSESIFHIRNASIEDAAGIAKVHVDSWRTTYQGIVSDKFLSDLNYESRTEGAIKRIQNPLISNSVGFADVGPCREKNLKVEAELYAIYLLKEYQGKGIGRMLFHAASDQIRTRKFKDFFVSVLSSNIDSVRFYQKMGGKLIGHDHVDIDGVRHKTDSYHWSIT